MRNYGFPGNNNMIGENRVRENYRGCGVNCDAQGSGLAGMTALKSGSYMGAVGKVVGMRGMRGLGDVQVITPTARAQSMMGVLGMRGLGSTDRDVCNGITSGLQASAAVATSAHQSSGGGDQGWTLATGIGSAIASFSHSMCALINDGNAVVPSTPAGQPPPSGSGDLTAYLRMQQQNEAARAAQTQQYLMVGGGAVVVLGIAYLLFK
jgi:hypothetical protein